MTGHPSRRHTTRDGPKRSLTSINASRDGCDRQTANPSQRPTTPAEQPDLRGWQQPSQPTTSRHRSADHVTPAPASPSEPSTDGTADSEQPDTTSDATRRRASTPVSGDSKTAERPMTSVNVRHCGITFRFPEQLPTLNRRASQILLAILVRLTEVEATDGPVEGDGRDC